MKKFIPLIIVGTALSTLAGEGMWMPQQIPQLAAELRAAGMTLDPSQLANLTGDPMGAVISLGGCTASFVSPEGLAVTNHHCAYGSIQHNSTPERDLIKNGFLARSKDEELPGAPGSRVYVTTAIEDVTDRVTGNLAAKLGDRERTKEIERRGKQLVADCEKAGSVRCRVASFFEGSQFLRTTQMEIRDVRLVYAPAEGIGDFGGETDNWMWPRHTGDFSFYRAYVGKDGKPADYSKDNVPYRPAHWLRVSAQGVTPGDFVFVAGYPGRTFRYRTDYEVRRSKEFTYPTTIRYATELNRILNEMGKSSRETQIRNASRVKGNDNVVKNYTGTVAILDRGPILQQRKKRESELAAWIASTPERTRKYGAVMEQIRKIDEEQARTAELEMLLTWLPKSSPMLAQAVKAYRWSVEKAKKDIDRTPGYQERDAPMTVQASERAQKQIDVPSDRAGLRFFLLEALRLPAGQRVDAVPSEGEVDTFLDRLYANTKMGNAAERRAMYAESRSQLDARNDAMLQFAAALMPQMLAMDERYERIEGAMSRLRPLYLQALREMTGGRLYPDANSTLRLTFGKVVGYSPRDGVTYAPQTTVAGVIQKDTGTGEFESPGKLLEAIRARRFDGYADPELGQVAVNFLSDVDTTGGNSGSPTLNAKGELVGLLFDGNYESLGSDFLFEDITRSIHLDATYMLWIMDAVDGAHNLLREMGITPKF